jgi:hypothetical protein
MQKGCANQVVPVPMASLFCAALNKGTTRELIVHAPIGGRCPIRILVGAGGPPLHSKSNSDWNKLEQIKVKRLSEDGYDLPCFATKALHEFQK